MRPHSQPSAPPSNMLYEVFCWLRDSLIDWLGLTYREGKVLFLGLDNAGKTTLLHLLKTGTFKVRRVWRDYYPAVDAVVFLVDSACPARLGEARDELQLLLSDSALRESGTPVAVLANKIDEESALGESEMLYRLALFDAVTGKSEESARWSECKGLRPVEMFMVSLKRKQGYGQAFRWIGQYLKRV